MYEREIQNLHAVLAQHQIKFDLFKNLDLKHSINDKNKRQISKFMAFITKLDITFYEESFVKS